MPFSDTSNKNGIIQAIERRLFPNMEAPITGSTTRMAEFTAEINLALSRVLDIIFTAGGTWAFDDSNHDDFPIITTDIEAGERRYLFTEDESGNLILDIARVFIKNADTNGVYQEIYPVDVETDQGTESFTDGKETQSIPYRYTKLGNGIFLDGVPPEDVDEGLKMYVSREGSYFVVGDTTKKAGFAGLYHEYLAVRASYVFATNNNFDPTIIAVLRAEMLDWEKRIEDYYGRREKDRRPIMRARITRFK